MQFVLGMDSFSLVSTAFQLIKTQLTAELDLLSIVKKNKNHVQRQFLSCVKNLVPTTQKKRSLSAYNN